jgi:hypothetical protein
VVSDPAFKDYDSPLDIFDDTTMSVVFNAEKIALSSSSQGLHFDKNGAVIDLAAIREMPPTLANCYIFLGRLLCPPKDMSPWKPEAMRLWLKPLAKPQKSVQWPTPWSATSTGPARPWSDRLELRVPVTSYEEFLARMPGFQDAAETLEINGHFWTVQRYAPEFPGANAWSILLSQPMEEEIMVTSRPWYFFDPPYVYSPAAEFKRRLHVDRSPPHITPVPEPQKLRPKP